MNDYPWFRCWADICTHPKTRSLTSDEFRLFIGCMTLAAERREEHGRFYLVAGQPFAPAQLADRANVPVRCVGPGMTRLVGLGLIEIDEDDIPRVASWDERQFGRPSDHPARARERKRESREVHAAEVRHSHTDVTRGSRDSHASVTAASRNGHGEVTFPPTPPLDTDLEPEVEGGTGGTTDSHALVVLPPPVGDAPQGETPGDMTDTEADVVRVLTVVATYRVSAAETLAMVREQARLWPSVDQRVEAPKFRDYWAERDRRSHTKRPNWKTRWANWIQIAAGRSTSGSARDSPSRMQWSPGESVLLATYPDEILPPPEEEAHAP